MSTYLTGDFTHWQSRCQQLGNAGSYAEFKKELDDYCNTISGLAHYQKMIWSGQLAQIKNIPDWSREDDSREKLKWHL